AKPFNHLRRLGSAIDQVADEHQHALAHRPRLAVRVDLRKQLVEQVEATVDVADHISAVAARTFGQALMMRRYGHLLLASGNTELCQRIEIRAMNNLLAKLAFHFRSSRQSHSS